MILFRNSMPQLDLHGEDVIGARIKVETFINDCYKLQQEEIAIVHGVGKGILKKEVLTMLKNDKRVKEFNIDCFNDGCTLARLYISVDKNKNLCYNTPHTKRGID